MLIPRRVKHRKQHHPGRSGAATGGTKVSFGEYGIQALSPAYVTNRQIESARIAMTRHIKRGGKVWIYKGDVTAKELAQQAAAAPSRGRGASDRPGRPGGADRGDRRRRTDRPAAEAAPAAEAPAVEAAPAAVEGGQA